MIRQTLSGEFAYMRQEFLNLMVVQDITTRAGQDSFSTDERISRHRLEILLTRFCRQ